MIRIGAVTKNGTIAKPADLLVPGDIVTVSEPEPIPPTTLSPEQITLNILYEDKDLIVVNKSAGLVVHPGAGIQTGTLVNALLYHFGGLSQIGGEVRPGIVHRLDKETSGCLVVARNDATHRHLSRQFAARAVNKVYLAICLGQPPSQSGLIEAPIARHPVHRKQMMVSKHPTARSAATEWKVLRREGTLSLVECRPKTGRTHQIRVHLKSVGLPIAGDPIYGRRGEYQRHLLHAWKLAFQHPSTNDWLTLTAPIPDDFPLVPCDDSSQH